MSCNINNYSIRRKLLIVSAALAYATVTIVSTQAVAATAHDAAPSASSQPSLLHPNNHNDKHSNNNDEASPTTMVPTFSCGTHWQSATQCNQLCIDGDDSSCPPGQHCYAGIPCSKSSSVEKSALQLMEMELMERLIWERDNNSGSSGWKGFVCGVSFQEAESSCSGSDHSAQEVHYCNSGQSSECPSNMQCYASVACSGGNTNASVPAVESSLSSTQQPKPVSPISFSSPTANITPIIHHEEGDGDGDDASLRYSYSFHDIVGTMGSRMWNSLGALSHS